MEREPTRASTAARGKGRGSTTSEATRSDEVQAPAREQMPCGWLASSSAIRSGPAQTAVVSIPGYATVRKSQRTQ